MNIDLDKVPSDLDEAVRMIIESLSPDELKFIREVDEDEGSGQIHHGAGMYIRNNWSLWDPDTPLSLWFKGKGITHGDDKSGIIFTSVWRQIRGQPRDLECQIKFYQDHWMKTIKRPIP